MKSTKNTTKPSKNTKSGSTGKSKSTGCGGGKNCKSSSQEEEGDPQGSYTGNPIGWGKFAEPVQDVDDL